MLDGDQGTTPCSAAGCTDDATWAVHWRNPRIHTSDRVKTWAACEAHRESLAEWLRSRGFPVVVTAFGETVEQVG